MLVLILLIVFCTLGWFIGTKIYDLLTGYKSPKSDNITIINNYFIDKRSVNLNLQEEDQNYLDLN